MEITRTITPELRLTASLLGHMRSIVNRGLKVNDAKMGLQDGIQSDVDGILAELVFAEWKNVWPDLSLFPRNGSPDFIIGRERVDLKSTRRPDGRLLATVKETKEIDVYVLAIIEETTVRFPGFAFASDLRSVQNLTDLGHGPTYAMTQDQLHHW